MIIKTRCGCGHINQSETSMGWAKYGSVPVTCEECKDLYVAISTVDEETYGEENTKQQEEMTKFEVTNEVVVDNKESEVHEQEGVIVDKDFLHYRVQFLDGKIIWLPYHWVVLKKSMKYKLAHYMTVLVFAFAIIGFYVFCKGLFESF